MKKLIQKLISTGADLSTKKALKNTLGFLGINPENVDKLYVELKNSIYRERFGRIPAKRKIVFIPHCLRPAELCRARVGEYGYECNGCSVKGCKAIVIKREAERRGMESFIIPGSAMAMKIIKRKRPKAVFGVACLKELVMAAENIESIGIAGQGVELLRDGCVNTDVDMSEVVKALDGVE